MNSVTAVICCIFGNSIIISIREAELTSRLVIFLVKQWKLKRVTEMGNILLQLVNKSELFLTSIKIYQQVMLSFHCL